LYVKAWCDCIVFRAFHSGVEHVAQRIGIRASPPRWSFMGTCIYGRQITRMVYALKRFLWVTRAIGGKRKGWRVICGKFFPQTQGGFYSSPQLMHLQRAFWEKEESKGRTPAPHT